MQIISETFNHNKLVIINLLIKVTNNNKTYKKILNFLKCNLCNKAINCKDKKVKLHIFKWAIIIQFFLIL
jgi:hypothetical protein